MALFRFIPFRTVLNGVNDLSVRYPSMAITTPTITPNTPSNPKKTGAIGTEPGMAGSRQE